MYGVKKKILAIFMFLCLFVTVGCSSDVGVSDFNEESNIVVNYLGEEQSDSVNYPDGNIVGIYGFGDGYGQIVFVDKNNRGKVGEDTYSEPQIWLCNSDEEPQMLEDVNNFDCYVRTFNISDELGTFTGISVEKNAGGSGSQSSLFGIAIDKNGEYLYGPYLAKSDGADAYIEIKGDEDEIECGFGFGFDGKLKYGNYDVKEGVKEYSKKAKGFYGAYSDIVGIHKWEVRKIKLVESNENDGFDLVGVSSSKENGNNLSSGMYKNTLFTDDMGLIKMDLSDEFIRNIGLEKKNIEGKQMYYFYNKEGRKYLASKYGEDVAQGYAISAAIGIVDTQSYDSEDPMTVEIGQIERDNQYYTVFFAFSGDAGPEVGAGSEELETHKRKWDIEMKSAINRIQGINNARFIRNDEGMNQMGSIYN